MTVNRKLAAVVFADVVGYSRLMERDEAGTHARLRELRAQLIDPKIAEHGGRIVRATGDGLRFEFPSATAALRCANLAAAHAQRGEAAKAAREKDILLRIVPGLTIAKFDSRHFYRTPEAKAFAEARLLPGLRKAGLPE